MEVFTYADFCACKKCKNEIKEVLDILYSINYDDNNESLFIRT